MSRTTIACETPPAPGGSGDRAALYLVTGEGVETPHDRRTERSEGNVSPGAKAELGGDS